MSDSLSGQNELKPWTVKPLGSSKIAAELLDGDGRSLFEGFLNVAETIRDAHNATLERKKTQDLGEKEASEESIHVLQNALTEKTLTEPGWYWWKSSQLHRGKPRFIEVIRQSTWLEFYAAGTWCIVTQHPGAYFGPINTDALNKLLSENLGSKQEKEKVGAVISRRTVPAWLPMWRCNCGEYNPNTYPTCMECGKPSHGDSGLPEADVTAGDATRQKIYHDFAPWRSPFHYDKMGTYVHDEDGRMVLDIRGWGRLTGRGVGGLAYGEEKAEGIQDRLGELVARLLTLTSVGALIEERGPLPLNKNIPAVPSSNVTGEQKGESDE